jgi:hypothetical protein
MPSHTPLSVGGLGKKCDPPNLHPLPKSIDSPFKVIKPPGQTKQKKAAELLEISWRAMALSAHLQEFIPKSGFVQLGDNEGIDKQVRTLPSLPCDHSRWGY